VGGEKLTRDLAAKQLEQALDSAGDYAENSYPCNAGVESRCLQLVIAQAEKILAGKLPQ